MRRGMAVIAGCLMASPTLADRKVSYDQPVALRLEVAQPTAVVFPEPVGSVSIGLAPEHLSLDYDGPYLFLQPLDPTIMGRCFVVGQSGKLYPLTFRVATPADDVVHLVAPPPQAPPHTPKVFGLSISGVLRALRTGTPIPGQETVEIPLGDLGDARIAVRGTHGIGLGRTLGLQVALENRSEQALVLDLRFGMPPDGSPSPGVTRVATWTLPPKLTVKAVAADEEVLSPRGQTRVYLVFERRP